SALALARGRLLVADALGEQRARLVLEVRADEPVELFQLSGLPDEHVLGDRVGFLGLLDRLAVRLDDAAVDDVERGQMGVGVGPADRVVVPGPLGDSAPGVPTGEPPSVAIRSARSSTISRTASTCGSSIWCTPMKCGPTT